MRLEQAKPRSVMQRKSDNFSFRRVSVRVIAVHSICRTKFLMRLETPGFRTMGECSARQRMSTSPPPPYHSQSRLLGIAGLIVIPKHAVGRSAYHTSDMTGEKLPSVLESTNSRRAIDVLLLWLG